MEDLKELLEWANEKMVGKVIYDDFYTGEKLAYITSASIKSSSDSKYKYVYLEGIVVTKSIGDDTKNPYYINANYGYPISSKLEPNYGKKKDFDEFVYAYYDNEFKRLQSERKFVIKTCKVRNRKQKK